MNKDKLNLALKITNWCNMNCAHCCDRCGPNQPRHLMPVESVHTYIKQFQDLNIPHWEHLVFTGGETMAPYYFGEFDYVPKCLDATYGAAMVPFFKTNGMWGANSKLRGRILADLSDKAYQYKKLNSLDISVDEFHDNVSPVAAIIADVMHDPRLMRAIRISFVGLDTPRSRRRFIELISQICARRIHFQPLDRMTMRMGSGDLMANVYYGFDTPVANAGRAADNKLGVVENNGMPDNETGSCLQIDDNDVATLNYKWREPVDGRNLNLVTANLFQQMKSHIK